MKPSDKTPEMEAFLKEMFGVDRVKCIKEDKCVFCGHEAKEFHDEKSRAEFSISGMCQKCQDETFGAYNGM